MTVRDKAIVSKVREIIESDGSYTIRDIAKAFSIVLLRMNIIFMRILKVRKISARWIAHILTDDQIQVRLQTAKQLHVLKIFPQFSQFSRTQFANIVTDDKTWAHYFEQIRKIGNSMTN